MSLMYLDREAEFDKYQHLVRDKETYHCGLIQGQTDNATAKPLCVDCDRRSRKVWCGPGVGYIVKN